MADDRSSDEIEITPEMIEAGEDTLLGELGGSAVTVHWSARDLAIEVYRAMVAARGHAGNGDR